MPLKTSLPIMVLLLTLGIVAPAGASGDPAQTQQAAAVRADLEGAMEEVATIVNQPIRHYPRAYGVTFSNFPDGWFHPGAITPDFDHVDISRSQEFPYAKFPYVTSPLNPNEMFAGADLEFNAMTKFFVTDRTVPKKRLSAAEMERINTLYRDIGRDERTLADLEGRAAVTSDAPREKNSPLLLPLVIGGGLIVTLLVLFRRKPKR